MPRKPHLSKYARLRLENDELRYRLRHAERDAFRQAEEHFQLRTRHLEAINEHLMKHLTDLANLQPLAPVFIEQKQRVFTQGVKG